VIRLEREDALWTVTIDRPDKANSLTREMLVALRDIARDAVGGPSVLVLTGEGRVFSAGADLDEAKTGLATDPVWEELSGAIAALPCLTIAVLNGTLAGGAFGMALACDLRIAVNGASFFYPVMKLGFLPQPSDPGRLAALVGPARAKLILMGGARLSAEDAMIFGLVDAVVPGNELMPFARSLTEDAKGAGKAHVAAIKSMIG